MAGAHMPDLLPHLEGVSTQGALGAEHLEVVLPAVQLAELAVAGRLQLALTHVADQARLVQVELPDPHDGLGADEL